MTDRRGFFRRLFSATAMSAVAYAMPSFGAAAALPQASRSSLAVDASEVTIPGDGATLRGYLVRPRSNQRFPAVIVATGSLENGARESYSRLASLGVVVLAVDPLSRRGGLASFATAQETSDALTSLSKDSVAADTAAARSYLRSHPAVRSDSIRVSLTVPRCQAHCY